MLRRFHGATPCRGAGGSSPPRSPRGVTIDGGPRGARLKPRPFLRTALALRLVSVNVGVPVPIGRRGGETVLSAIGKSPVAGPVKVRTMNLDGDGQADLRVHGGASKAVYAYPSEHYAYWRTRFPGRPLGWGSFGENFTTEGLLEVDVRIGEELRIGTARFAVTQPRSPCYKLGMTFGTERMIRWFQDAGRPGFYLRVMEEGTVSAGDPVLRWTADPSAPTVLDEFRTS